MKELIVNDEIYSMIEMACISYSTVLDADRMLSNYKGVVDYRVVNVRDKYFLMEYQEYNKFKMLSSKK